MAAAVVRTMAVHLRKSCGLVKGHLLDRRACLHLKGAVSPEGIHRSCKEEYRLRRKHPSRNDSVFFLPYVVMGEN